MGINLNQVKKIISQYVVNAFLAWKPDLEIPDEHAAWPMAWTL